MFNTVEIIFTLKMTLIKFKNYIMKIKNNIHCKNYIHHVKIVL